MEKLLTVVRKKGLWGTVRYFRYWLSEKFHERRLGIDTAGYISLPELGLQQYEEECGAYEPISYRSIFDALNRLGGMCYGGTFIDFGSGKGRAVIAAATYPFKRAIGVELSAQLNEIAEQNAERARARLMCQQIEFITADATEYDPPGDVSIALLYNPFSRQLTETVIARLLAARDPAAGDLRIIYKYPQWAEDPLEQHPHFELQYEQADYSEAGERLRLYAYVQTASQTNSSG